MFLNPSSFKDRTLNMAYFREWAGEVSNSYLNAGVPPTDSLCKIAQQEELTPHQIEVLAGEINKEIHRIKYASMADKYFAADFPLADAKIALKTLQADGGQMKVSEAMPEPVMTDRSPDMFGMFGIEQPTTDKTASVRFELKVASVRGELLDQRAKDEAILAKYAAEASEGTFIKQARQIVLKAETSADRMKTIGGLHHFAKCAGVPEGCEPLAKLAHALGKEGLLNPTHAKIAVEYLTKHADQTAPQALISEWLPAQVVNGEHPLYISLKTFKDHRSHLEGRENDSKLIQDQLNVVKQKVRAL